MIAHGFTLDPAELSKLHTWMAEQDAKLITEGRDPKEVGAIGGRYTYCFTPTGIGCVVVVHDDLTDSQLDVTDYSTW